MMKTQLKFRMPFFQTLLGSLNILEYVTNDPISDNIRDPVIKRIGKCRKHSSILTIADVWKEKKHTSFSFLEVAKIEVFREI